MARTPNIFFKDLPAVFHLASPQIVILDPLFLDGVATSLPSQKKLSSMGVRAALKPCLADTADGVCRIESPRNSADIACRVLTGPYGGPLPAPLVGLCAPAGREERTGGFNADHDAVDFPAAPRRSQTPSAPRHSALTRPFLRLRSASRFGRTAYSWRQGDTATRTLDPSTFDARTLVVPKPLSSLRVP
jgi:hypothetical protein